MSVLSVKDVRIGGQAGLSARSEDYMGFPTGISGTELAWRRSGLGFGHALCSTAPGKVHQKSAGRKFPCRSRDGVCASARSIVVATGVQYCKLSILRIEEFKNGIVRQGFNRINGVWQSMDPGGTPHAPVADSHARS